MEYNCKYKRNCMRGINNNNVSRTTVRFQLTKTFFNKSGQQHHTNKLYINIEESSADLNIFKLLFYLNNQNCSRIVWQKNILEPVLESFKHTNAKCFLAHLMLFSTLDAKYFLILFWWNWRTTGRRKNYRRTITEA